MSADAPTAEDRLVREALLALGGRAGGLADAARAVTSWRHVVERARAGSVAESVWAGLALHGATGLVPEPEREALRDAHEAATARNALLLSEATRLQGVLAGARVDAVVVKGPGLLVAHYPDIGARHVGDVDVLVRERDAARAEEALVRVGVHAPPPIVQHDGTLRAPGQMVGQGEIGLTAPSGVLVELQDRIAGGAGDGSDVEGLLSRSRTVTWNGAPLRIPSAPDLALSACLHVFDNHAGEPRFLPRHLADLAVLLLPGPLGWPEVERLAGRGAGRAAVDLSRELLERGPPSSLRASLHAMRARARGWSRVIGGRNPGPASLFRLVLPARAYMATRYGVDERSPVVPLLYLWRPVLGAWTVLRGK
jgi:hypothetical protein